MSARCCEVAPIPECSVVGTDCVSFGRRGKTDSEVMKEGRVSKAHEVTVPVTLFLAATSSGGTLDSFLMGWRRRDEETEISSTDELGPPPEGR